MIFQTIPVARWIPTSSRGLEIACRVKTSTCGHAYLPQQHAAGTDYLQQLSVSWAAVLGGSDSMLS